MTHIISRVLICGDRHFGECPHAPTVHPGLTCPATIRDNLAFTQAMRQWTDKHGLPLVLIEGCAQGADSLAGHDWAPQQVLGDLHSAAITVEHYPARWEEHDSYGQTCWCSTEARFSSPRCRGAGPIRNQAMLTLGKPEAVIAFHRDLAHSKGTRDMVTRARKAGIPVWVAIKQP